MVWVWAINFFNRLQKNVICWNPSRSLRFWGHEPPISFHGPAVNLSTSKPRHFGLFGLTVQWAQELEFSNSDVPLVLIRSQEHSCIQVYKRLRNLGSSFSVVEWAKAIIIGEEINTCEGSLISSLLDSVFLSSGYLCIPFSHAEHIPSLSGSSNAWVHASS